MITIAVTLLLAVLPFAAECWANDTLTITDPQTLQQLDAFTSASEEMVFGGDFERGWLTWERHGDSIELTPADTGGLGRPGAAALLRAQSRQTCWLQQALPLCHAGKTYLATFDVAGVELRDVGIWQFAVQGADKRGLRHVWGGARHVWQRRGVLFAVPFDQPVELVFLTNDKVLVDNVSVRPLAVDDLQSALTKTENAGAEAHWRLLAGQMAFSVERGAKRIEESAQQLTDRAGPDASKFRTLNKDFAASAWLRIPEGDQAKLRKYVSERLDARYATLRPYLARWHPGLSDRRLRILFLNYMVHFNTQYAPGRPGATLKEQIGAVSGDCEVLARRFVALTRLWLDDSCRLTTVGAWAIGHALASGDGYIADPSHNIVWFLDAAELNKMPDQVARYLLYHAAVPGVAKQLLPPAVEPNHRAMAGYRGREDAYRFSYTSYLEALAAFDRFYFAGDYPSPQAAAVEPATDAASPVEHALVNVLTVDSEARVSGSSSFSSPPNSPEALLESSSGTYAAAADSVMPQWIEFELGAPAEVEAAAVHWWSQEDRGLDFSLQCRRDSREPWAVLAAANDNDSASWHTSFSPRVIGQLHLEVTRAAGQGRTLISRLMLFGKARPVLENLALTDRGLTVIIASPFFPPPNGPEAMFDNAPTSYAAAQDDGLPDEVVFTLERPRQIEAVSATWYDKDSFATDWTLEVQQGEAWVTALHLTSGTESHGLYLLDQAMTGQNFRLTVNECHGQQRLLARELALLAEKKE